jgi:hypothetical protein
MMFIGGVAMRALGCAALGWLLSLGCAVAQVNVTATGAVILQGERVVLSPMEDMRGVNNVTDAPFSATTVTTTISRDPSSRRPEITRTEMFARDPMGRYRWQSHDTLVQLSDPVRRMDAQILPQAKVARVTFWTDPIPQTPANQRQVAEFRAKALAAQRARPDWPQVEDLGEKTIMGVRAIGKRSTYTIPAGAEGNDKPIAIVTEIWFSPELKFVLARTQDDPRKDKVTMVTTELKRDEPDAALFKIPADYRAVDQSTGQDIR